MKAPLIVAGIAVVLLATACGTSRPGTTDTPDETSTPAPEASELAAQVLWFEAAGSAPGKFAALSEDPIRFDAFASWYGGAGTPTDQQAFTTDPGSVYLLATDSTGCRTPETVSVTRTGTDLRVAFEGGADHPECVRAVGPIAYIALPADKVGGVETVNGKPLLDPAGPGKLADFVPLGPVKAHPAAAELPGADAVRAQLAGTGADMAEVDDALNRPVAADERGFAFLVSGCNATGAVLLLDHQSIDVGLTGEKTCVAPEYFLATFTAATKDVPENAVLATR